MPKKKPEMKYAWRHSFILTTSALERLAAIQAKTGLSRASVACELLKARKVEPPSEERIWYPHKQYPPLSLSLTPSASERLLEFQKAHSTKTVKRSWSDILEALLWSAPHPSKWKAAN